jgi:hypothetical protein
MEKQRVVGIQNKIGREAENRIRKDKDKEIFRL